jgi:hypothetical protein
MGDEQHRLRRIATVDASGDDVQNHAGLGVACYQRLHFDTEQFELPYHGVGHLRRRRPGGVGLRSDRPDMDHGALAREHLGRLTDPAGRSTIVRGDDEGFARLGAAGPLPVAHDTGAHAC